MKEELSLLGLNDTEIKVYLALLELGESPASEIAKKSGVPRASIYDVLGRLIKAGLCNYIIKNFNKYFSVTDPQTILENLEYKKSKIKEILPKLEEVRNKESKEKQKTEVYEGKKGVESVFNMMLKEKEILALGGSGKTSEVLPYFMPRWNKERRKRGITVKMIYNESNDNRKRAVKAKEENKPIEYKFLDTGFLSPILTIIFGDKIMLGTFTKDPSVILIKNKEIAETYKQYFSSLWKTAKK